MAKITHTTRIAERRQYKAIKLHNMVGGLGIPLVILSLLLIAIPVQSQTLDECTQAKDADKAITLCSQLIRSGTQSGHNLSVMYNSRGSAYADKGKYELAIADYSQALMIDSRFLNAYANRALAFNQTAQYDQAIADSTQVLRLNSRFVLGYLSRAFAYNAKGQYDLAIADYTTVLDSNSNNSLAHINRGAAYFGKGEYALAVADYTQALYLNPYDALAYSDRGRVLFATGKFADAIRDFSEGVSIDHSNAYPVLWLHLARSRAAAPNLSEFAANVAVLDHSAWPAPLVQLFRGKTSSQNVLRLAVGPGERCEAFFYLAEWNILHNNLEIARNQLQQATSVCPRGFGEYPVALAELKRLTH